MGHRHQYPARVVFDVRHGGEASWSLHKPGVSSNPKFRQRTGQGFHRCKDSGTLLRWVGMDPRYLLPRSKLTPLSAHFPYFLDVISDPRQSTTAERVEEGLAEFEVRTARRGTPAL